VGTRIQPDLYNVGHRNTIAAHGPAEHRLCHCGYSDVEIGRGAGCLQRKAKSFEDAGVEAFKVDDRRDTMHKPEAECVGRCEQTKTQTRWPRRRTYGIFETKVLEDLMRLFKTSARSS